MIDDLRSRFDGLEKREQTALIGLAAFLSLVVFYMGVWTPANSFVADSEREFARRLDLLQYIRSTESEALASRSSPGRKTSGGNLLTSVTRVAQSTGVSPSRMQPEGGDAVSVWFDSVSFNRLMLLLERLETSQGIVVRQISVDGKDEPGLISARVVLRN